MQNALEEKADDRLKNIVATIQDEQNKIIRADEINQLKKGVFLDNKILVKASRVKLRKVDNMNQNSFVEC